MSPRWWCLAMAVLCVMAADVASEHGDVYAALALLWIGLSLVTAVGVGAFIEAGDA